VRTIGIACARVKIEMANLVNNFKRLIFWRRIAAT
jgi:transposase, IS5 family